jgi:O-antigen/teichoic acid export membrane protein
MPATTLSHPSNDTFPGRMLALRVRVRFWLTRATLAVFDEGLIAGSNFLVGVLLARWLEPDQYGAYALAYSIYLALYAAYRALILEPVSVYGPTFRPERQRWYLGELLKIQLLVVLPILAVLGISSLLADHIWAEHSVSVALVGVTLAAPFLFLFSFTRFSFYMQLKPGRALSGAVFYFVLIAGGLVLLNRWKLLSPLTAFLLMAAATLVSSAIQLARLKPAFQRKFFNPDLTDVWHKHWSYGRWSLPTAFLTWLPANIYFFLVGSFCGVAQAGALKVLANFIVPLGHVGAALSLLVTPYVSGLFGRKGASRTSLPVWWINTLYFIGGISYCALIAIFREPLFHALYGNRYSEFIYLVPCAGVVAALNIAGSGSRIGLRATQSPSSLFVAYGIASVASVVFGIPLVRAYGLAGAIAAAIISSLAMFLSVYFLFRRKVAASPVMTVPDSAEFVRPGNIATEP